MADKAERLFYGGVEIDFPFAELRFPAEVAQVADDLRGPVHLAADFSPETYQGLLGKNAAVFNHELQDIRSPS